MPDANWATFNTFRAGNIERGVTHYLADAIPVRPQFCRDDCDQGKTYVWVDVANAGLKTADAIGVDVVSVNDTEEAVLYQDTVEVVESGHGMVVGPVLLLPEMFASGVVEVRLNLTDDDEECDDTNNAIVIEQWPCGTD